MLATLQEGMRCGSLAVIWKTEQWKLVNLDVLSTHMIVAKFLHMDDGLVRVLVGHMECEPGARKRQWDQVQSHLAVSYEIAMPIFIDHNSVIVPRVDSVDLLRKLPETVSLWSWPSWGSTMFGCTCTGSIGTMQ